MTGYCKTTGSKGINRKKGHHLPLLDEGGKGKGDFGGGGSG